MTTFRLLSFAIVAAIIFVSHVSFVQAATLTAQITITADDVAGFGSRVQGVEVGDQFEIAVGLDLDVVDTDASTLNHRFDSAITSFSLQRIGGSGTWLTPHTAYATDVSAFDATWFILDSTRNQIFINLIDAIAPHTLPLIDQSTIGPAQATTLELRFYSDTTNIPANSQQVALREYLGANPDFTAFNGSSANDNVFGIRSPSHSSSRIESTPVAIPEPASLLLVVAGSLVMLRRSKA